MKPFVAFGVVAFGGVIAVRYLPRASRRRLGDVVGRRIMKRMEQMMASLSEGARPSW